MIPQKPLDLEFQPDTVVLKQFSFSTTPVASTNMYYLWCSVTQNYIATLFYRDSFVSIEPMTTFSIYTMPQDISFRIEYGYPGAIQSGIIASWAITMEFSRGQKAEYFISSE